MPVSQCIFTEQEVQEAFLAAPPLIAQTILDLTVQHPRFYSDIYETAEWPLGNGTIMKQPIFRGEMPQIERGLDAWKQAGNNTGCDPCEDDCGYNVTQFGGSGFEEKIVQLMSRDFFSPSYCIKQIQTTAHFEEVFSKIIENLYAQVSFFKEFNIGQNFLTMLAKKYLVDSDGPKPNPQNPYVYRNALGTRLGTLGIDLLEFFYEWMRRDPSAVPLAVVDGNPVFAMQVGSQMLSRLYRDDPNLRQDVRFSGLANDLVVKYNFMSSLRNMFIPAPILYPRRFNIDSNGDPVEVLPFLKGLPMQAGTFTGQNPAYETATHEEVIIHGMYPFKVFYQPTAQTLGANTSFGPEPTMFDYWTWVNPMTVKDPFRRKGYFATHVSLGLSQQFSDSVYGLLLERVSPALAAVFTPNPVCPEDPPDCNNSVPDVGCPCPIIVSSQANPITAGNFFLTLTNAVAVDVDDTIQLGVATGGYVDAVVASVNTPGAATVIEVAIEDYAALEACDIFTAVFCDDTMGCQATVVSYTTGCTPDAGADDEHLVLTLSNPIKGDVGEDIDVYFGNGTSLTGVILSFNWLTNELVLDLGESYCDDTGGVLRVCVPTATDATCSGCAGVTLEACTT